MKIENYNDYLNVRAMSYTSDEEVLNIIKTEFENFLKQTGRYPTTQEIDAGKNMPSSRSMQRRFGGVQKVREMLGMEITNYTKGESRAAKAKICNERSVTTEDKTLQILLNVFPIQTIHQQAKYSLKLNNRCDFLVYNKTSDFYIDVFYTENILNLNSILNIKLLKYETIKDKPVYFIVDGLNKKDIIIKLENKVKYLPDNFKVITLDDLDTEIKQYTPYSVL